MSLCSLLFGMDTGQCGTVPMYLVRSLEVRTARQCMDLRSAGRAVSVVVV